MRDRQGSNDEILGFFNTHEVTAGGLALRIAGEAINSCIQLRNDPVTECAGAAAKGMACHAKLNCMIPSVLGFPVELFRLFIAQSLANDVDDSIDQHADSR